MKNLYKIGVLTLLSFAVQGATAQYFWTFNPAEDANVVTFGGGQGGNAYLKFDISSIPAGATILGVTFECNVKTVASSWDGDAIFYNVHSQTWTEADMMTPVHALAKSDTTNQPAGFALGLGWTTSVDLTNIFMEDYAVGNTYCSILIRDPDDVTFAPPALPLADFDTLAVGNNASSQHIIFWARESVDPALQPKMNVNWCMDSESFITTAACDSFTLNATTYYASGLFTQVLPNATGCDSTINLNLTIGALDDSVYLTGTSLDSLVAVQTGVTYQWIDCDSGTDLVGETSQNLHVPYNGNFACIISQGSCIDTSDCIYVYIEGLEEGKPEKFNLFPNPASEIVKISTDLSFGGEVIYLTTISGKVVQRIQLNSSASAEFEVGDLPAGVYLIRCGNDHFFVGKLVVR